ncbi:hypothetical protein EHS25_008805 [Saitozyma podzolica]|uniref:Solute carrier family 66 member 3 n=1 Tax=Saitozyma podzolica TaxID=1890683 RepID=A0A427YMV8_9TREE|nr:hypothetical protein EHS25_008805 [Saitozyma podzolica]
MSAFHSAVTSVTHNIPSILRDPAVALIGERCYTVLVYDFDITNVDCLKYALSKGLGLGIVLGGAIILKIVSTRSARGLSLSAYILETTSYAISLAYASRNHFPFSTYGENFFLTIQNVVITLLILFFSGQGVGADIKKPLSTTRGNSGKVVAGAAVAAVTGFVLWSETLCPLGTLALLQAATLPLSLISKAPQIISNLRNQSTGNLSAFAVFNALLGCLARLFTTKQEVNDPLIFWGFFGAAVLNAVLAVQMLMYWNNSDVGAKTTRQRRRATEEGIAEPIKVPIEEKSPTGKRWARKLD